MQLTVNDVINSLIKEPISGFKEHLISEVVIDSRKAKPGALFVALPGEQADGHDYVSDAFSRGALAALVQKPLPLGVTLVDCRQEIHLDDIHFPLCLLVDNTQWALQEIARNWRNKFTAQVIGITGSVGKSSTKELTAAILSTRYCTLKNPGNLNNEIGLPLSLLQLNEEHERVVLEMGMYALGEVRRLCEIARPRIGMITNVGPVHLERLGTIEKVAEAKAELIEALPDDGVAILNRDDERVMAMAPKTKARVFTYGLSPEADLSASDIESEGLEGVRFKMHYQKAAIHVKVPLLGRHSVHTSLRAAAVGLIEGLNWQDIMTGLQDKSAQLRLVSATGPFGSTILDDTYNASPMSSLAALNLLEDLPASRRIAVLGSMLELGSYEEEGHRKVGGRAAAVVDQLITIGEPTHFIADEARLCGLPAAQIFEARNRDEVIEKLSAVIQPGDVILIKGSRALLLEEVVNALSVNQTPPSEEKTRW
jgi:UDP-N-acetylmuramoyl-tripeptide--D-alanyl-D-alanine ligase